MKRTVQMAKSGVPSAKQASKAGTPKRKHWFVGNNATRETYFEAGRNDGLSRTWHEGEPAIHQGRVIHPATAVFLMSGAKAASEYLGGSLRAKELLPLVLKRAKFFARRAKHVELEAKFLAQMRAAHVHENIVPDGRA